MADSKNAGEEENSRKAMEQRLADAVKVQENWQSEKDSAQKLNLEPEQKLDEDQPAVMAGLTKDQLGTNAHAGQQQHIQQPTKAQELKNDLDADKDTFSGNNAAEQKKLYDLETSGAAAGLVAQNTNSSARQDTPEQQERERREEASRRAALYAITTMGQLTKALYDAQEEMADVNEEAAILDDKALELVDSLTDKIDDLEMTINFQKAELEDMRLNDAPAEEIEKKELELKLSEDLYEQYKSARSSVQQERVETLTKVNQANENMEAIQEEIAAYKLSGEQPPQELIDRFHSAQEDIQAAKSSMIELNQKSEAAFKMNQALDNMRAQVSDGNEVSTEQLTAQRQLIALVSLASVDGVISKSELDEIKIAGKGAGVPERQAEEFAKALSESGVAVQVDNDTTITGEQAGKYAMAAYGIETVDAKLAALDSNSPDYEQQKEALFEQRYELEKESLMTYGGVYNSDIAAQLDNSTQALTLSQANLRVEQATSDTVTYGDDGYKAVVYSQGDTYFMQTNDGKSYKIDDQPNAAEIMADINAQIAAGKSLGTPEIQELQMEATKAQLAYNDLENELYSQDIMSQYYSYADERYYNEGTSDTATTIDSVAAGDVTSEGGEKELALNVPEYTLEEAEAARREVKNAIENNGGTLTIDEVKELSAQSGISEAQVLEEINSQNGKVVDYRTPQDDITQDNMMKNTLGVAANTAILASFPIIGITGLSVPSISAPKDQPNANITALNYKSFADSPEFAKTNPAGETTYNKPLNNGTKNVVDASNRFNEALENQPAAGSGAPTPDELMRLEQEKELLLQQRNQMLAAQNDVFNNGPKPNDSQMA